MELGPAAAAPRLARHDAVLYALLGMPVRFSFLETMPDVLLSVSAPLSAALEHLLCWHQELLHQELLHQPCMCISLQVSSQQQLFIQAAWLPPWLRCCCCSTPAADADATAHAAAIPASSHAPCPDCPSLPAPTLQEDTHAWQPPASGARVMMWRLAERLAPHLPGVDAERRAVLARILHGLPAASAHEELAGIEALRQAVRAAIDAAPAARQQEAAAAVDPAEVQALALRRARALATRRSCGNPCCASLVGVSEAGSRGKKCTGCRLVRFCGAECSKQDWRLHKRACRALQQAAGDGGGG